MFRIVGGVILGYITMFVIIALSFYGIFFALGSERSFQPGSYEVTALWIIGRLLFTFVAALTGGMVAVLLARGVTAARALSVLIVIFGILSMGADKATAHSRPADVSVREAMINNEEPSWFGLAVPILQVVGVLQGGRTKKH